MHQRPLARLARRAAAPGGCQTPARDAASLNTVSSVTAKPTCRLRGKKPARRVTHLLTTYAALRRMKLRPRRPAPRPSSAKLAGSGTEVDGGGSVIIGPSVATLPVLPVMPSTSVAK